jgi:hypothetical protein
MSVDQGQTNLGKTSRKFENVIDYGAADHVVEKYRVTALVMCRRSSDCMAGSNSHAGCRPRLGTRMDGLMGGSLLNYRRRAADCSSRMCPAGRSLGLVGRTSLGETPRGHARSKTIASGPGVTKSILTLNTPPPRNNFLPLSHSAI